MVAFFVRIQYLWLCQLSLINFFQQCWCHVLNLTNFVKFVIRFQFDYQLNLSCWSTWDLCPYFDVEFSRCLIGQRCGVIFRLVDLMYQSVLAGPANQEKMRKKYFIFSPCNCSSRQKSTENIPMIIYSLMFDHRMVRNWNWALIIRWGI